MPAGKTLHTTEVLRSESLARGRLDQNPNSAEAGDMDWLAFALYGCVFGHRFLSFSLSLGPG